MNSSTIEILNNITNSLHRFITPVLYLLGNIGNILSIIIFFKKSWKKNICVFYFNVCLLINLGYINSTMLGSIFTFGFNINIQNPSAIMCKIFYYISYLFSALLPNILILSSIDRLLISSQNIDTRLYSSKRLACFSVTISTLFWIIFYLHIIIKVNVYETIPSVFICYYETSGFYFEFISYSTLIIAIGLAIALIILSILIYKNVRQIQSCSRQQRHQFRTMRKKDFQLLCCLYIHDIVYIIFNIFLAIYYVYIATTKNQVRTILHQTIDDFLNSFGTLIHHIPYCASFFIFIIVSKTFRHEVKRIIYGKKLIPMQEENNRQ